MKKYLDRGLVVVAGLSASSLALAEGASAVGSESWMGLAKLGAAIAIGLGTFGAATGQGRASSAAMEGIARNPTSRGDVFVPLIIALAFMEFQALLSFIVALMLVG